MSTEIYGEMNFDASFYEACHSVSKSGCLTYSKDYWRKIAKRLTPQETLEVYCLIRERSGRLEREWRDEFTEFFSSSCQLLPAIPDHEFWPDELYGLIRFNDLYGIRVFLREIGVLDQTFDPRAVYKECAKSGFRDGHFHPLEGVHDGTTPIELAIKLEHFEIANYLRYVVKQLEARFWNAYEKGKLLSE